MSIQVSGIQIFDNSGEKLETVISRAIDRYKEKFGKKPTHCKISLAWAKKEGEGDVLGVKIMGAQEFSPGNLLIGVEVGHG